MVVLPGSFGASIYPQSFRFSLGEVVKIMKKKGLKALNKRAKKLEEKEVFGMGDVDVRISVSGGLDWLQPGDFVAKFLEGGGSLPSNLVRRGFGRGEELARNRNTFAIDQFGGG